jgi:hypothetical protein
MAKEMSFPAGELAEELDKSRGGRKSCSLVRVHLLENPAEDLKDRCKKLAGEGKGQTPFGYRETLAMRIRSICDPQEGRVFSVIADPEVESGVDKAHAKVVRASHRFSKGFVRKYRDKLAQAFSQMVHY